MTDYKPAVGDRVRATLIHEGVVKSLPEEGEVHVRVDVEGDLPGDLNGPRRYLDERVWSFEKLQDPEPKWVHGDVILIHDGDEPTPLIYTADFPTYGDGPWWACASCSRGWHSLAEVAADWRNGDVEILYKADA